MATEMRDVGYEHACKGGLMLGVHSGIYRLLADHYALQLSYPSLADFGVWQD